MARCGEWSQAAVAPYEKVLNYDQHDTPFARNSELFFEELEETGKRLGLPSFMSDLDSDAKERLYGSLKTCIEIAVHVSPLALLRDYAGGLSLDRSSLIQVSAGSLPNDDLIDNGTSYSVVFGSGA